MVTIRVLQPGGEAALERFLQPQIASSMFLLGNLRQAGLVDQGQPLQGTYAGAFDADRLIGVVGHFWNGTLIPQAPLRHLDALWRAAVAESGRAVSGIVGPHDQAEAIREALGLDDPNRFKLNTVETLYQLTLSDLVFPEMMADDRVHVRRAGLDDEDLMTEWRVAYAMEVLGERAGDELWTDSRESVRSSIEDSRMWVLDADEQPVSCTGFNASLAEAVQVGGVYTPPALRSRGYARCAVAGSLRDARNEGVEQAILFTDEQNVSAQRAYEALGFRAIGRYRLAILRDPVDLDLGS